VIKILGFAIRTAILRKKREDKLGHTMVPTHQATLVPYRLFQSSESFFLSRVPRKQKSLSLSFLHSFFCYSFAEQLNLKVRESVIHTVVVAVVIVLVNKDSLAFTRLIEAKVYTNKQGFVFPPETRG